MPFGYVSELKVFLDCNDILHEKMNGLDLEKNQSCCSLVKVFIAKIQSFSQVENVPTLPAGSRFLVFLELLRILKNKNS